MINFNYACGQWCDSNVVAADVNLAETDKPAKGREGITQCHLKPSLSALSHSHAHLNYSTVPLALPSQFEGQLVIHSNSPRSR